MVLLDITARFNFVESFLYDYIVAPAVLGTMLPFKETVYNTIKEDYRILDIGCGGGHLAIEIAKAYQALCINGVDLSMSQLKRANLRSKKAGLKIDFIQASALDMPFLDDSFDLVYSVDSLKHWPERLKGLMECVRIVKPGGKLLITEVNRDCTFRQGIQFVRNWRVPAILRPFSVVPFFIFAVMRSLTVEEARSLADMLPLNEITVESDACGINWTITAIKPLLAS
jgi:ubiquinone/menaquinone biosynthesis C-methylase UbiE